MSDMYQRVPLYKYEYLCLRFLSIALNTHCVLRKCPRLSTNSCAYVFHITSDFEQAYSEDYLTLALRGSESTEEGQLLEEDAVVNSKEEKVISIMEKREGVTV